MHKLYYLQRKADFPASKGNCRAVIVLAESAGDARATAQNAMPESEGPVWITASTSRCVQIGISAGAIRYENESRVILADFKES